MAIITHTEDELNFWQTIFEMLTVNLKVIDNYILFTEGDTKELIEYRRLTSDLQNTALRKWKEAYKTEETEQ